MILKAVFIVVMSVVCAVGLAGALVAEEESAGSGLAAAVAALFLFPFVWEWATV